MRTQGEDGRPLTRGEADALISDVQPPGLGDHEVLVFPTTRSVVPVLTAKQSPTIESATHAATSGSCYHPGAASSPLHQLMSSRGHVLAPAPANTHSRGALQPASTMDGDTSPASASHPSLPTHPAAPMAVLKDKAGVSHLCPRETPGPPSLAPRHRRQPDATGEGVSPSPTVDAAQPWGSG